MIDRDAPRGCRIYAHSTIAFERNFTISRLKYLRSGMTLTGIQGSNSMARNFGVPRQIDRHERARLWPMWVVALATISVVNAAAFLHHR
jgi:hypothetical protein